MITNRVLLLICFVLNLCLPSIAESLAVGEMDLSLTIALHPKMSSFDYNRMGFYKKNLGLKDNENFNREDEINTLKIKIAKPQKELEKLSLISKQEAELLGIDIEKNIKELKLEISQLKNELENIRFEIINSDITNTQETREIFEQISIEIINIAKEVAKEEGLNILLNSPISLLNSVKTFNYKDRSAFYHGAYGFNEEYYIFLSEANRFPVSKELPNSKNLSFWLELSKDPVLIDVLPIEMKSMTIEGGKNILPKVLKALYLKYSIPKDRLELVKKALQQLESE